MEPDFKGFLINNLLILVESQHHPLYQKEHGPTPCLGELRTEKNKTKFSRNKVTLKHAICKNI